MHYYTHNIGDYRRDTSHLTLLEHGVYRQVLDQYYLNEKPIDLDTTKLERILNIKTEEEKNALANVLQDFFVKTKNHYVHKRCDIAIDEYQSKSQKAAKAANIRWAKDKSNSNADAMPTNNQEPLTINHITNNHKPQKLKLIVDDVQVIKANDFDSFWKIYPKKIGKEAARKSWLKNKPDINLVTNAIKWQEESSQWKKGYIPNPATYINQHRWLDEPEELNF